MASYEDGKEVDFFDNPIIRDSKGNIIPQKYESEMPLTKKDIAKAALGAIAVVGTGTILALGPGLHDGPTADDIKDDGSYQISNEQGLNDAPGALPEDHNGKITIVGP